MRKEVIIVKICRKFILLKFILLIIVLIDVFRVCNDIELKVERIENCK